MNKALTCIFKLAALHGTPCKSVNDKTWCDNLSITFKHEIRKEKKETEKAVKFLWHSIFGIFEYAL